MCWVAFDRGRRRATAHGRPADLQRWTRARDAIYDQIMDRGWDADRRAFVQHYGSRGLDSSLLRMSGVGFIAPPDPMWLSTPAAMDEELVTDSREDAHLRQPPRPPRRGDRADRRADRQLPAGVHPPRPGRRRLRPRRGAGRVAGLLLTGSPVPD